MINDLLNLNYYTNYYMANPDISDLLFHSAFACCCLSCWRLFQYVQCVSSTFARRHLAPCNLVLVANYLVLLTCIFYGRVCKVVSHINIVQHKFTNIQTCFANYFAGFLDRVNPSLYVCSCFMSRHRSILPHNARTTGRQ